MNVYNYWTFIGVLVSICIFLCIRWNKEDDKFNEFFKWVTIIITVLTFSVGILVYPITTDIKVTKTEFKVVKVTKKNEKVFIFNNKGLYFELIRTFAYPKGGADTIKAGDVFIHEAHTNYYGYTEDKFIPSR